VNREIPTPAVAPASLTVARLKIIIGAALFSTGGAAIKACDFSGLQVAGLRSGIAALAIFLLLPSTRNRGTWRPWLAGLAYSGVMVTYTVANKYTTAANAVFLQNTSPLYILLLSPLLLGERIRRGDLVFLASIALGMGLLFAGQEAPLETAPDPLLGNIIGVACGACWGLTILGLRWLGRAEGKGPGSAASAVFSGNVITFLVALPAVVSGGGGSAGDWLSVAYLGVFQVALAYVFVTAALRHLHAFEASLLLLVEPVLNPIWALILHGEMPGGLSWCGGALILLATTLRTIRGFPGTSRKTGKTRAGPPPRREASS